MLKILNLLLDFKHSSSADFGSISGLTIASEISRASGIVFVWSDIHIIKVLFLYFPFQIFKLWLLSRLWINDLFKVSILLKIILFYKPT